MGHLEHLYSFFSFVIFLHDNSFVQGVYVFRTVRAVLMATACLVVLTLYLSSPASTTWPRAFTAPHQKKKE